MRTPFPTLARCEPVVLREARYFAREFRGTVTRDELEQEARIIALHVLNEFDPHHRSGATLETFLTYAIRKEFRRRVKRMLMRAFLYRVEQIPLLRGELQQSCRIDDPLRVLEARRLLDRARRLPKDQQHLIRLLVAAGGRVKLVADAQRWPLAQTYRRVRRLRETLRENE